MPERRRKPATTRRVDELAAKVEALMSQLAVLKNQNGVAATAPVASISRTGHSSSLNISDLDARDTAPSMEEADDDQHGPVPATISPLKGLPDIVDRGLLGLDEAYVLIRNFETDFVPIFPFVAPAPRQTASLLKQQDPFFFLCIVSATISNTHPLRQLIADEIMRHITVRIIEGSERTLDLLRGLLVQSAWYRQPAQRGHVQLVLFVQLCVTMAYDMNLDKKPALTSDERRSLLGAYWLSTRPIAMKHTKQIDECCDILSESPEHSSDRLIQPYILLSSFLSKTEETYEVLNDPHPSFRGESFVKVVIGPVLRHLETLKASTEQAMASYRQETRQILFCDMHYIDMCIRDVALDDGFWTSRVTPRPNTTMQPTELSPVRVSMLWDILKYTKALIFAFTAISDAELPHVGVFTLARLCTALALLPKAVYALLKITVTHGIVEGNLNPSQISEAQAIIDEAGYLGIVAGVMKKLDVILQDLTGPEREIHVVGSLITRERILAHCYAPRIKSILGVDLVNSSSAAPVPPEDIAAETLLLGRSDLPNLSASLISQQLWPLSYAGLADNTFLLDDAQWASIPDTFANFG
ncbi:Fc.00g025410.m01.CDS01 [Cosmosporella sp. VM-42]